MDENKNSKEDLVTLRNYVLGVVGFATAVSAVLIQALHFRAEPTIICVAAFAVLMLLIVFLISKSEKREAQSLTKHIDDSNKTIERFDNRLESIDKVLLDIQKSTLRTELNSEMYRNPENHDTILKIAEKYFLPIEKGGLQGNWYMASKFYEWAAHEKVKLPEALKGIETE